MKIGLPMVLSDLSSKTPSLLKKILYKSKMCLDHKGGIGQIYLFISLTQSSWKLIPFPFP